MHGMEPEVADGSDEKGAQQAADGEDYYDLKKTLPRFYRLFEHLNKGQRPTPSIMANALDVVERMCKKDALEKVIDGFMRLDGTFSVEVESGRVVLRRRLLHLRIQFNGMRLFRSYAPVVEGDKASRLAYAATAPELIERFPQRVDGVELARKYLLALLPLSEKEVQSSNVMTINCPEKPREILEQIVGIPGLRSIVDNFDITVDIQSTAPANLLSALGLPEGHGFRGRGVIWSWRHAAMSTFAAKAQPLEQLLSACLSGGEFLWFTLGVLQGLSYEGMWFQRPGGREDSMLLLLRPKQQQKKLPSLPLGPWHEAVQREALQVGECGPDAIPVLLQLVPAAYGDEAELRAREVQEIIGTEAATVVGSLMTQSDGEQVAGRLAAVQLTLPFGMLSSRYPAGVGYIHSLGDMVRRGHEGSRLEELQRTVRETRDFARLPFTEWMDSWLLATREVPGWLQHFVSLRGPLAKMKMSDRHIAQELATAKTKAEPDLFSALNFRQLIKALKENDPLPSNLCALIAGGTMSFEVTPTDELVKSLDALQRLSGALWAFDLYRTRPWYSLGFLSHGSLSGGSVLVGASGQLCMAGYGLGTVASVNPLADALQLSTRLLLEDCPLPVAHEDLYALMLECGTNLDTIADWLRVDQETAKLIIFMSHDDHTGRRPVNDEESPPVASLRDLSVAGPWPGAPVVSRADARQAQMEAQALTTALAGLVPGAFVPDAGCTAGLLEDLCDTLGPPSQHGVREIAKLAKPRLSPPRQWAWDLQIAVLEAVEERLAEEQFQFASDTDPSLRSEYEGVCAFSCAMLVPQLLAALQLIFTKDFPPWQCLWALRHAHAVCFRLVRILQAYVETKTLQSMMEALSVPVPEGAAAGRGRKKSVEDAGWAFRKVEDHSESIAGLMLGGVCFDLKHCLLVRLTYKKAELGEELRPKTPSAKPKILKSTQEKAQQRRASRMGFDGAKRPQSSRRRSSVGSSRLNTTTSGIDSKEPPPAVFSNPGGEMGFTDPLPGIVAEELLPGASTTGMAILRGLAFALYGWPCPGFEGPEPRERDHLEPYLIELPESADGETHDSLQKQDAGKLALQRKPVCLRGVKSVLDTLPSNPPGQLLRRIAVPQLRGMMDKNCYYRGNILEVAYGMANSMGPLGVTLVQSVSAHKQAEEFKLKVGISQIKANAALVRAKESVELMRPSDLTALLDSEDWFKNNMRMAWSFESNAKEGVYIAGEGPLKAFQELRKVVGWIDGGRANVMPAMLVYDAHRVEVSVPSFFTSPAQSTEQDPRSLITVVTKLVLFDYENFLKSDARREAATVDLTLKFRYSPEVRVLSKGTRIRLLRQDQIVFEEAPNKRGGSKRQDSKKTEPELQRRDSNKSEASRKDSREEVGKGAGHDRKMMPKHTATIVELSASRPGLYEIQLDGIKGTALFDPQPGNYELAGVFRYAQTQPLIVFMSGGWIDAIVHSISYGNFHEVYIRDPKSGARKRVKVSLNDLNHTPAKLSLANYTWCSKQYVEDLRMRNGYLRDALTSRFIDILSLPFALILLHDKMEENSQDFDSESAGDSSSSSAESDIDLEMEGVDSTSLEPHEQAWRQLMQDIAPISNKAREAGAVQRRAVVVWGSPGSGKTTLLRRLVLESLASSAEGILPVILEAKDIVKILCPSGGCCTEGDVLDVLLRQRSSASTYLVLWQALYSRRVLLLVDGGDENDPQSWEFLTHYLHHLTVIGHPVVLFARPLQSSFRWHLKDHFDATSSFRLGCLSQPLQRLGASARLGLATEDFQSSFKLCEAMRLQPAGLALLLSQAELRASGRLARTTLKQELSTMLLGQMVEAAIPCLISTENLSACLPEGAASWVIQLLEVMAMKLFVDADDLLLPDSMTKVIESEHPDLEGSWRFVRTLILSNKFVLVEPCLPSFQDERRGKVAMRFVPKALRDYFLARCFTRYMKEKRIIGLPLAEDIIFDSVWNLFFDLMIEMAATHKVNISLDLRKKKELTEAQLTNFTQRMASLEVPVIQLEMPPHQVELLPELRRLLQSSKKSANHLGLRCNALGEEGAQVLAETLPSCEVTFLQLENCLLGEAGTAALAEAFLRVKKPAAKMNQAASNIKLALPGAQEPQDGESEKAIDGSRKGFKVNVLDLSGNALGPEGVRSLVPVLEMRERDGGVLERLGLDENSLGPSGAEVLAQGLKKNSVLKGLSLARNRLRDEGLECLAKAMPGGCGKRLRRLVLSNNEFTPLAGQVLAEAFTGKACAHLERLDLANNSLQADGMWFLGELLQNGMPNLKELDLEYTDAGSVGAGYLADALLAGIPLRRLELCGCRVGAQGAQRLAEALRNPQGCRLTRLGLRGNAIEDQGVTALANSILEVGGRCHEFERSQRLTGARATSNASVASLRRGPSTLDSKVPAFLTQLQELDVSSNRIGLFGVDALAAVITGTAKTRLTSLDVSRNCLGRQGAAALAAGLDEGCPLQHLNVSNAKMGDGGAEAIAKGLNRGPKAIVWLQLQENRIGLRGLQLLVEALPKVPGLQRLAASGNLASDDWPCHVLENLISANRAGITKPSVQLLSPSGRRWLGYRVVHQNTSFGSLDPRFATVLQLEEAQDGSKSVRRTSVLKASAA